MMKTKLRTPIQIAMGITLLSLFLTAAPSWAAAPQCAKIFHTQTPKMADPMRAWFQERRQAHDSRFPSELTVNGILYQNVLLLGGGREGYVYLAQTANGPVAIKVFHAELDFREGVKDFKNNSRWLPKLHVVDRATKTIITEYKEGIDVFEIVRRGHEFGISAVDRAKIEERWSQWVVEQKAKPYPFYREKPSFIKMNVIYSFKDDTFYLIDAF